MAIVTEKCPVCGELLKPVSCCSKSTQYLYCFKCKKKFLLTDIKKV